jgi:hypothetical protein
VPGAIRHERERRAEHDFERLRRLAPSPSSPATPALRDRLLQQEARGTLVRMRRAHEVHRDIVVDEDHTGSGSAQALDNRAVTGMDPPEAPDTT